MRYLLLAVISCALAAADGPLVWEDAALASGGDRAAVLIAADRYSQATWDIPFAKTNTDVLAKSLPTTAGVPARSITLLHSQGVHKDAVSEAIRRAAEQVTAAKGLLLVYYTGHGYVDGKGRPYFFTYFTREQDGGGYSNVLGRADIANLTAEVRGKASQRGVDLETVIIFDACRTRTMGPPPRATFQLAKEWEVYSTSEGRFAEAPTGIEASPFTKALVGKLQGFARLGRAVDLPRIFPEIKRDTQRATGGLQVPEIRPPAGLPSGAKGPELVRPGRVDAPIRVEDADAGIGLPDAIVLIDQKPALVRQGQPRLIAGFGRHRLQVSAPGHLSYDAVLELGQTQQGRAVTIRLREAFVQVTGQVVPPMATPVSIIGYVGPTRPGYHQMSATTGADGRFVLSFPAPQANMHLQVGAKQFKLPATAEGYQAVAVGTAGLTGALSLDQGRIMLHEPAAGVKPAAPPAVTPPVVAPPVASPPVAAPPVAAPVAPAQPAPPAADGSKPGWADAGGVDDHGAFAEIIRGGIAFRFRYCPAGTYQMGSPATEAGRKRYEVQHAVTLTQGFWILDVEVNQRQWGVLRDSNPSFVKNGASPVQQVSWRQAVAWCKEFGQGLAGVICRLPTEAEWEYACRAGTTGPFNRADLTPKQIAVFGKRTVYPGKRRQPNAWGLYDMHGNVFEWCVDAAAELGSLPAGAVTDPVGREGDQRVYRGGSWRSSVNDCRSAVRHVASQRAAFDDVGFRCILIAGAAP